MPLATLADIAGLVRCPLCGSPAALEPEPRCTSPGCAQAFPRAGGQPVLIHFELSIFTAADIAGPRPTQPSAGGRIGAFLGRLTYGGNLVAAGNLARFVAGLKGPSPLVLVIGGGSRGSGTEPLYESAATVVGTDVYPSSDTLLICDAHRLPFADGAFAGVVIQAVLEHVLDPQGVVDEIHRVLKPDGLVYAETPFIQQVHEGPYDFTRFTHSGHRWLFRRFEEIDSGLGGGPGLGLIWSISYFARALGAPSPLRALVTALFFWVRFLERLARRRPALDAASGVYFLGARSQTELKPNDMPAYYEGRSSVS